MKTKLLTFLLLTAFAIAVQAQSDLQQRLQELSQTYGFEFRELPVDSLFAEKYVLYFEQPLDHGKEGGKTFRQRVFLSHLDTDRPLVFITEGYAANHAENPRFVSELAGLLQANQVCVEHRYFGESVPDSLDWKQLTVANAAADHHRIIGVLRHLYPESSWVSTGISKGGQTAMIHRCFYPEDVDVTVPYVAPLCFSEEDLRVYRFLSRVGDSSCRQKILDFQTELLKNRQIYQPAFEKLAAEKQLTYRMGIEKAFDLTVFEYSFAFWQWGRFSCEQIPVPPADADSLIRHLDRVAGLRWISDQGIEELQPFFYQAMRELGFYGYDIEAFRQWTVFDENPVFNFTLPEGELPGYDPAAMEQVDCFVRHRAEKMLFIYGETDPWSAPAVDVTLQNRVVKIVKPGGSHRTRIANLPDELREQVMDTLQHWLKP